MIGDYNKTCSDSSIDNFIGLSLNSQELIKELHEALFEEKLNQKKFEEIVHSILDDIQMYKRDYKKLEQAYKKEKERYEESIKQMLDEAEYQMFTSLDKTKNMERSNAEKMIENLKLQHEAEIASLQMSLNKMILLEKKYQEDKVAGEQKKLEFQKEIQNITDEKMNLTTTLREYQTQLSVYRSEIAELKANSNEKDINRKIIVHLGFETSALKNEINILQETNKKLNDTNDILFSEITTLRTELAKKNQLHRLESCVSCLSSTPINSFTSLGSKLNHSYDSDEYDEYYLNDSGFYYSPNGSMLENKSIKGGYKISNSQNALSVFPIEVANCILNTKPNISKETYPDYAFKLVFAGDSSVGKTSFIAKYCNEVNLANATKTDEFKIKSVQVNSKNIQLEIWDTCGQEKFNSIDKSYYRRAHGFVLMYDISNVQSFENVRKWIRAINETCDAKVPILIVGNKSDLRSATLQTKLIKQEQGELVARNNGLLFTESSIKDDINIYGSLNQLCNIMAKNQDLESKYLFSKSDVMFECFNIVGYPTKCFYYF